MSPSLPPDEQQQLQQDAASCVKCALCAPHCPTYRISLHEADSPRGRIALMAAATAGEIPHTAGLQQHLDQCLSCGACESVCPAKVPYGRMITTARKTLPHRRPFGLYWLLEHPRLRRTVGWLAWGAKRFGLLRRLAPRMQHLPTGSRPPTRLRSFYPAVTERQAHVALFTGCSHDWLDPDTLQATITVLTHLGCDVSVPKNQVCCGALRAHAGLENRHLTTQNHTVFGEASPWDWVVNVTTGCEPTLQKQGLAKLIDLYQLLAQLRWPKTVRCKPLAKRVALHRPCSQRISLKTDHLLLPLLEHIPELNCVYLKDGPHCCGGAGSYALTQPEMARRLGLDTVRDLNHLAPELLVSSNIGCTLQLKKILLEQGVDIGVLHPITLLAEQLELIKC